MRRAMASPELDRREMVAEQATDMAVDLAKGGEEAMMGAPDAQLPAMAGGGEKELLIGDLMSRLVTVKGGASVAGKMNPGQKKWVPYYWLVVAAASVIVLNKNNHIHAAPKDQLLFPPELAMFTVLLSAICLIILSVKQMM